MLELILSLARTTASRTGAAPATKARYLLGASLDARVCLCQNERPRAFPMDGTELLLHLLLQAWYI